MEPNLTKDRIEALLKLLQDDNVKVASLAMEQILNLGSYAHEIVQQYRSSTNPRLRRRINQLAHVLNQRGSRQRFIDAMNNEDMELWDGILEISKLQGGDFSPDVVAEEVSIVCSNMTVYPPTASAIAGHMREQGFAVPEEDMLDSELYQPDCILSFKYGAAVLLCALAHHIGRKLDWTSSVILHEGRFCLADQHNLVIDPADNWSVKGPAVSKAIHTCTSKEVWLGVLSQLFLVSMMEEDLKAVYNWASLLAALEGETLDSFPYPLGHSTPGRQSPR